MRPPRLHTTVQVAACAALLGACAVSFPEVDYQTVDGGAGGGTGDGASSVRASSSSSSRASSSSSSAGAGGSAAGGGAPCSHVSDCGVPEAPCVDAACVDGVCTTSPSVAETPCVAEGGNVCDGQGQCVECLIRSDCPTVECQSATCGSDEKCAYAPDDGASCGVGLQCHDGSCGCTMDDQCGMAPSCRVPHCDLTTSTCQLLDAPVGTACMSGTAGAKFCDAMGFCSLQCVVAMDCAAPPTCAVSTCNAGICGTANAQEGQATCAGGVCDGSGNCVACNVDKDCPICFSCNNGHVCTAVADDAQETGVCDDTTGGCGGKCVQRRAQRRLQAQERPGLYALEPVRVEPLSGAAGRLRRGGGLVLHAERRLRVEPLRRRRMPMRRHAAWALVAFAVAGACTVPFPEVDYQTVDGAGGAGATTAPATTGPRGAISSTSQSSSATGGGGAAGAGGNGVTGGAGGGCTRDEDCPAPPNPCEAATCVEERCVIGQAPAGTMCTTGGGSVCDGQGDCVDCVQDLDCPPQECQSVLCVGNQCMAEPASGMACGTDGFQCEDGACNGCLQDVQCMNAGVCQVNHCQVTTGQCVPANAAMGTPCVGPIGQKFCDGSGDCSIECETATDCTVGVQACRLPQCVANACSTILAPVDTPCTSPATGNPGFCTAAGSCVDCVSNGDCPLCERCTNANKCTSVAVDVQDSGRCDDTHGGCGTKCACASDLCKRENGQPCAMATQCATSTCSPVGVTQACGPRRAAPARRPSSAPRRCARRRAVGEANARRCVSSRAAARRASISRAA